MKSFFCVRCRRYIPIYSSRFEAVRTHYWKHHRRTMLGRKHRRR